MEEEIEAFRSEVLGSGAGRRLDRHRYTDAMKAKALELTAKLRKRGATMVEAAKRVGIPASMLYAWKKAPKRKLPGMVRVRIVPETPAPPLALARPVVRVLSPRGYRFEVADATTAVAILRELG
ncbi:MAG TPA: transposase [Polyangia bacterium]